MWRDKGERRRSTQQVRGEGGGGKEEENGGGEQPRMIGAAKGTAVGTDCRSTERSRSGCQAMQGDGSLQLPLPLHRSSPAGNQRIIHVWVTVDSPQGPVYSEHPTHE